jgi:hypothetical protein
LLLSLAGTPVSAAATGKSRSSRPRLSRDLETLIAADLVTRAPDGKAQISAAGRAYLARRRAAQSDVAPYLGQHLTIGRIAIPDQAGAVVLVDEGESPLAWLARRKGRDGRPLIAPEQLQAGERLRADFTRAGLTPRVTSSWSAAPAERRRGGQAPTFFADAVVAARQRVRNALAAVGPEFSGLLLDVCCFLKGLEDIERERCWPPRSAKVVLQLGLDRLARHFGLASEARGPHGAATRAWQAEDAGAGLDGL